MVQPGHIIDRIPNVLKTLGALVVIGVYLVGTTQFESIHGSFHAPKPDEAHSLINEEDPCHRNIYHNDQQGGCHHQSHVSVYNICSFCGIAIHNEYVYNETVEISQLTSAKYNSTATCSNRIVVNVQLLTSRAPPADVV